MAGAQPADVQRLYVPSVDSLLMESEDHVRAQLAARGAAQAAWLLQLLDQLAPEPFVAAQEFSCQGN